jgi:uncharacterized protein DUF5619
MTATDLESFRGNHISVTVSKDDLDTAAATALAKQKAMELSDETMLLAWYCGLTGDYYPKTECGRTDKPPWMIYAESRGADIAVNINDGEYIFMFLSI